MKLTQEQLQAAEFDSSGPYAIKGVAGSGKTSIGLHRAHHLLQNKCPESEDQVLILTFNRTLIKYLEFQSNKLENELPRQMDLGVEAQSNASRIKINTISDVIYNCFERCNSDKQSSYTIIGKREKDKELRKRYLELTLDRVQEEFPDEKLLKPENLEFLYEEIIWLRTCMLLWEKDYQQIDRTISGRSRDGIGRLPKNSPVRKAVFRFHEIYRVFLKDQNIYEFVDTEIVAINYARKNPIQRYAHIIIDESQDLTRLQLEFVKSLVSDKDYASTTFLYDTSQSIYSNSWLGMGKSFISIGFNIKGKSKILRKNYRTSNEILSAARNVISAEKELLDNEPFYCNQTGIRPFNIQCKCRADQNQEIIKLVKDLSERFGLSDIAITSRYNKNLLELKSLLQANGLNSELINRDTKDYGQESLKLLTFHSFKGLESKVVIIEGLSDAEFPFKLASQRDARKSELEERRLFYVAMTRASRMLFMFSYNNPTPFITDIAPELMKHVIPDDLVSYSELNEPVGDYGLRGKEIELLTKIESDNRGFIDQRQRIEESDKRSKREDAVLLRIHDFIQQHHILLDEEQDNDSGNLLEGLFEEFQRKAEENSLLRIKLNNTISENQQLLEGKREFIDIETILARLKKQFPDLDISAIDILANAEFVLENLDSHSTDYSPQYLAYSKVVEMLLRKAVKLYGIELKWEDRTLGKLYGKLKEEEREWCSALRPLDEIDFVSVRNNAAHSKKVDFEDITELRKVLYEQNTLSRIVEMVA